MATTIHGQTADDYEDPRFMDDRTAHPLDGTPGDLDGVLAGLRNAGFVTADPATFTALDDLTRQLEALRLRVANAEADANGYAHMIDVLSARLERIGTQASEVVAVVALPDGSREVYLKNGRVVTRRYFVADYEAGTMTTTHDEEAPVAGTRAALAREAVA